MKLRPYSAVAVLIVASSLLGAYCDTEFETCVSGSCSEKSTFSYLIGSGWHASVSGVHPLMKINSRVDATVRTPSWFPLWYAHLTHFTNPVQVVVTDSDSPLKPEFIGTKSQTLKYPLLQWIELTENFGHEAVSVSPTVGGWERSVLQGAMQAILNDVDYYVYVEQDLLVRVRPMDCRIA